MSGILARLIAQGVVFGVGVATKAFQEAYSKAQAGGRGAAKAAASTSRMPVDQARQVLNLEKADVTMEKVAEQFSKYYSANDPDKGGSLYLQAKLHNARESLVADIKRQQEKEKAAAAGEGGAASTTGGDSNEEKPR